MKKHYYYIDEAGSINANSKFFILGCYKTDSPEKVRASIRQLKDEITNSPYFAFERQKFMKEGFHACENHFDIRARFYNLISILNVRFYILIIDKRSSLFQKLVKKDLSSTGIYGVFIKKLLKDRLTKHRNDHNILIFEEYGSKQNKWKEDILEVIEEIKESIHESFDVELSYEVSVHSKEDENISVIDYVNFLFVQFYEHGKVEKRMTENFRIIEPKIGLVYKMDKDLFYHSKNKIDIKRWRCCMNRLDTFLLSWLN